MAVMQQRILYLLEQYQLGQEGAAGTDKGGTAHKVRQHPWRAFWQAGCVHLSWGNNPFQAAQARKVISEWDIAFYT